MTQKTSKHGCGMELKLLHYMKILCSQNLHNLEKFRALSSLKLGQGQKSPVPGPKWPLYGPKHLSFNRHDHYTTFVKS